MALGIMQRHTYKNNKYGGKHGEHGKWSEAREFWKVKFCFQKTWKLGP